MTLEERINRVRADTHEAGLRFKRLIREMSEACQRLREHRLEWRIARIKHCILVAESKKNRLLGDCSVRSVRQPEVKHCGLPIQ